MLCEFYGKPHFEEFGATVEGMKFQDLCITWYCTQEGIHNERVTKLIRQNGLAS